MRRCALGAVRQALRAAMTRDARCGLYVGRAGVALAAARVGILLAEDELLEGARDIVAELSPVDYPSGGDLLDGIAGTIVALLVLGDELGDATLSHAAAGLGDRLIETAVKGPGLSWSTKTSPRMPNLTGFSHGAAGGGFALVELYAATGEHRFADAAEQAFNYERAMFDFREANWPDFRQRGRHEPPMSAWCHGGPGIALSRLAAHQRFGGDRWRAEAETGLTHARDSLIRYLDHAGGNFSLCHGLAGNGDILLDGARVLGGRWSDGNQLAVQAALAGAARHAREADWPCGLGPRQSPGLLLGMAGIGYFFLRAAGGEVPSVLRITRLDRSTKFREDTAVHERRRRGR
jgi:lantibiotic modifying enzyme